MLLKCGLFSLSKIFRNRHSFRRGFAFSQAVGDELLALQMALSCSLLAASPAAFSSSNESLKVCEVLPKCLSFAVGRKVQGKATLRAVAIAAGNGGGCCGGGSGSGSSSSGGGCSSHRKSSPSDLSNVGKEFEEMVAKATLTEFEKEYNCEEMTENITRDIVQEVMNTGPARKVHKRREESLLDIDAILAEARSASKGDEFVFDDLEDRKTKTFEDAKDFSNQPWGGRERERERERERDASLSNSECKFDEVFSWGCSIVLLAWNGFSISEHINNVKICSFS